MFTVFHGSRYLPGILEHGPCDERTTSKRHLLFLIPGTLMWDLIWKQGVWRGDGMWPSVQVQLTLVLTRRGNVGTEVATNKQGIRRCTGRLFKASWSLGKTIRTPRTDGHQGYAQRLGRQELLCPQSPSLRGHQPCPHRGSDLGLHAFRTLRLRRRLWYEVIQLMVFFCY